MNQIRGIVSTIDIFVGYMGTNEKVKFLDNSKEFAPKFVCVTFGSQISKLR